MEEKRPLTDVPLQPNNPSNQERYALVQYSLEENGRLEDFPSLLELLSPPPDITTITKGKNFKHIKVAIIGGGMAGMAAAFELKKAGFNITVFEALKERIGGRIYTHYFNEEKSLYGELGAMRIPVSHETVWHYINLFNLPTRPFVQSNESAFIYVKGVRVRNDSEGKNVSQYIYPLFPLTEKERLIPWFELLGDALEAPLQSLSPQVRREILEIKRKYDPQIIYWDYLNIRQVLENHGLSQGAIDLLTSIDPLTGQFLYHSFSYILEETYPASFAFMYEIPGGMVRLPHAFYKALTTKEYEYLFRPISSENLGNVTWKGGHWVSAIRFREDTSQVTLSYSTKEGYQSLEETFDYIICTIPFSTLRLVEIDPPFSNIKMQAIREVNYETSQKTILLCSHRFWEEGDASEAIVGGGSFTDLPISSIWYPSDHAQFLDRVPRKPFNYYSRSPFCFWGLPNTDLAKQPGVLTASYNYNMDAIRIGNTEENSRIQIIKRQLEMVHGLKRKSLDNIVQDYKTVHWNREPAFKGAFCIFNPEQRRLFSYGMAQPEYSNRIFFAGEHISTTHAWIQGALKTGMVAANDLATTCLHRGN